MAAGLQSEIWNNNIRSIILLAIYPLIILGVVFGAAYVVGYTGAFGHAAGPAFAQNFAVSILYQFWPIIMAVVGIWFLISYFFNATMIGNMAHARPVTRREEPALYNMLENLCIAEGIKTPRLSIIETDALNAFASGIDARSYTVTVTRGLMNALSPEELEAVIGHELAHIINRDVRLMMICVVFTGMLGIAAQMVWSNIRYGLFLRGNGGKNSGGGVLIVLAIGVILWIGYMATIFTRLALSRRREYMADAGAVMMTKNPAAIMGALMKIAGRDRLPAVPADVAMMCIENSVPFFGLFATHPPIEARIRAIATQTRMELPPGFESTGRAKRNPWMRR